MTRIEDRFTLEQILDQHGDQFVFKVLIRDYEDKIQAYKGSSDRIVKSWHDQAVKCKGALESLLPAMVSQSIHDNEDESAWYEGAKS